ncbi:hypothetical protein EBS80_03980, partial [bacterium]|nr:hypothetical protein [bacterium]
MRTAIAQAVDKAAVINAAVGGHGRPIEAPILPGSLGEHPDVAKIAFDVSAAQKTLEDAGYKLPEGGTVRTLKKAPGGDLPNELSVTITTVKNAEFVQAAEAIASELAVVGIKADVNAVENGSFFATVIEPHAYQILLTGTLLGVD